MARETLSVALDLMFGHEGGYVNAKTDRGGPISMVLPIRPSLLVAVLPLSLPNRSSLGR
ncbi:hypothetical protein N434_04622 [Rhizobium sp. UGM030330-04]|nr:hypothetical protein N434_04622 [Rhizobium sp. UGM030330-04]